jgi:hypothetical protein
VLTSSKVSQTDGICTQRPNSELSVLSATTHEQAECARDATSERSLECRERAGRPRLSPAPAQSVGHRAGRVNDSSGTSSKSMNRSFPRGSVSSVVAMTHRSRRGRPKSEAGTVTRIVVPRTVTGIDVVIALLLVTSGRRSIRTPVIAPPLDRPAAMNSQGTAVALAKGYPRGVVLGSVSRQNDHRSASHPAGTSNDAGTA